jgi:hypothetical protein
MSAAAGMITMDVEGLTRTAAALDSLAAKLGIPIKWLAVDQLRLLLADVIKFLPPKTRKAGESAAGYDISRVVQPMTPAEVSNVREFGKNNHTLPGGRIFTAKSGAVWLVEKAFYEPQADDARIAAHHRSFRDAEGRVSRAGTRDRTIGRWKAIDTLHVGKAAYDRYRNSVKKHVGQLKAGFIPGYDAARAYTGGRDAVAAWVRKVAARIGSVNLSSMDDRGNGEVSATNRVPYGGRKVRSFLPSLMAKRGLDIDRAFRSEKRAQQILDQFNAGKL